MISTPASSPRKSRCKLLAAREVISLGEASWTNRNLLIRILESYEYTSISVIFHVQVIIVIAKYPLWDQYEVCWATLCFLTFECLMCLTKCPEQTLISYFSKYQPKIVSSWVKWFDILTCVSVMRQFLKTVWGFFSEFASPSYQQQQQQQTYTEANAFVLSKMRQPRDKKILISLYLGISVLLTFDRSWPFL